MAVFSRSPAPMPDFDAVLDEVEREAPAEVRPYRPSSAAARFGFDRLFVGAACCASVAFFLFAYSTSVKDPDYFSRQLIASLLRADLDPITTGTTEPVGGPPIPGQRLVRTKPVSASDYEIVMVYSNEAILSTRDELLRVKVGSDLPGLGEITAIQPTAAGGLIRARLATLRAVRD